MGLTPWYNVMCFYTDMIITNDIPFYIGLHVGYIWYFSEFDEVEAASKYSIKTRV